MLSCGSGSSRLRLFWKEINGVSRKTESSYVGFFEPNSNHINHSHTFSIWKAFDFLENQKKTPGFDEETGQSSSKVRAEQGVHLVTAFHLLEKPLILHDPKFNDDLVGYGWWIIYGYSMDNL